MRGSPFNIPTRFVGSAAEMITSLAGRPFVAKRPELCHRVGRGELLASHAGHEPSAADFAAGFEPPVDPRNLVPAGRSGSLTSRSRKTTPHRRRSCQAHLLRPGYPPSAESSAAASGRQRDHRPVPPTVLRRRTSPARRRFKCATVEPPLFLDKLPQTGEIRRP